MEAFGNNYIYYLKDNSLFSPIEYKVLGNQSDAIFVRAMKIIKNGHVSIFYLTENLSPLSKENAKFDENKLCIVVKKVISNVIEIKDNGFLSCKNLMISLDEIFVNPSSLDVKFIYIPTTEYVFEEETEFDNKLRSELIKLIDSNSELLSDKLLDIKAKLYDSRLSFREVFNQIRTGQMQAQASQSNSGSFSQEPAYPNQQVFDGGSVAGFVQNYIFVSEQPEIYPNIILTKTVTIIGKSEQSDVKLSNNAVSRRHCSITLNDKCIYIVDEGSKNGTFVNGIRLNQGMPMQINIGDEIKIAQVKYRVLSQ